MASMKYEEVGSNSLYVEGQDTTFDNIMSIQQKGPKQKKQMKSFLKNKKVKG
jgi:hypothetical protein